jgi:hypothetical protein
MPEYRYSFTLHFMDFCLKVKRQQQQQQQQQQQNCK